MALTDRPPSRPAARRAPERREFDLDEGKPLALTLKPVGFAGGAAAEEAAQELVATYITGTDVRGPAPMPWLDIPPSRTLFRIVTLLEQMQCPKDPAERLDRFALMRLSEDQPNNWAAVLAWFTELTLGLTESLANFPSGPKE